MKPDDLRAWRKRNIYSQGRLARELGIIPLTVSRWERGVRAIPPFLHLALEALELRGGEKKSRSTKRRKEKKHGKKNARTL